MDPMSLAVFFVIFFFFPVFVACTWIRWGQVIRYHLLDKLEYVRVWLHTPPKESDFFFVTIRTEYQRYVPCDHRWMVVDINQGEETEHGPCHAYRKCLRCTQVDRLMTDGTWEKADDN